MKPAQPSLIRVKTSPTPLLPVPIANRFAEWLSPAMTIFSFFALFATACTALAQSIPSRPEALKFPPLKYEPPSPVEFRVKLASGPVAYIVPDRELPLVQINILVRVGHHVEPTGKEGIASLTGNLLARGGAGSRTAEDLEERLDFLSAILTTSVAETQGSLSLNLLSKDLDEGLSIIRDVLTQPRFQEDRLQLRRDQILQEMKQRNDDSADIESRERLFLAYGTNYWATRLSTSNSIAAISKDDLQTFHKTWFHPDNFVVAASGDFDKQTMSKKLDALFANWPFKGSPGIPVPGGGIMAAPGAYMVDKDVNQGRVMILLPGIMRDHPDYFAVTVMNDILGGGGFTSRIMNRVRSDEGLAYSASSAFPGGTYYPLQFMASFQSKSRTVAYAISIVLEEMQRIAREPVPEEEIETARRSFIDPFPRHFASKAQIANTFAQDEFTGRFAKDPNYWKNFRSRIAAVTPADVLRTARNFLKIEQARILVIGQKGEILKGHPNHPVQLRELVADRINDQPLRNPMTMEPAKPSDRQ